MNRDPINHPDAFKAPRNNELKEAVRELLLALDDEHERGALRVSTWTFVTRVRAILGNSQP
jgi:hypothetical protein